MNFYEIPKYVINLPRRKDRLANITNEFKKHNLVFNIWKAVDGKDLKINKKSKKLFEYNSASILGCMLSHHTLIKHAKEKGYEYICVFEDDIIFCNDLEERIKYIEDIDFDIFYLGGHFDNYEDQKYIKPFIYNVHNISGTYGYIMKNTVFDYVINNMTYNFGADEFFSKMVQSKFKSYSFIPFIVDHIHGFSDIALGNINYPTGKHFNNTLMKMLTFNSLETYGRLANQLFEIAGTLGIAKRYGIEARFPEKWKYRKYFNIPDKYFEDIEYDIRVVEKEFCYIPDLIEGINGKIIDVQGTLQSERYFKNISNDIKKWLKPKGTIDLGEWAVGIHIRRGDYINNPAYINYGAEYYLTAILKYFNDSRYKFYICSDDIDYCKHHFIGDQYIIEKRTEIDDLKILAGCHGHILCNSSYSWMGAYLSESKKVVRPPKIFKGKYGLTRDEKDFWIKEWICYDEKLDLKDVTFIIPVKYDHYDRMDNLRITIDFLSKFDTNIIIGEQGGNYFKYLGYKYIHFPYKEFHRTRMLNRMTMLSETPYVINWDADVIVSPFQLYKMVDMLRNGYDFVYPYDGRFVRVGNGAYERNKDFIDKIRCGDIGNLKELKLVGQNEYNSVGGAIGYNKDSFIKSGMENENFIAYTPEDVERYERFKKLGYKIGRADGCLYHMNHYCGQTSNTSNPFYKQGVDELNKIRNMKTSELKKYSKADTRKVFLVTYADDNYVEYQKRLTSYAEESGMFDKIISYNRQWLIKTKFYKDNKKILDQKQGGGFCLWKPYIILETMKQCSKKDIILYMDSMDMFDGDIRTLLLKITKKEDIILTDGSYKNSDWTKRDCFVKMDCDEPKYHNTIQLEAGVCIFNVCDTSKKLIEEWMSYCVDEDILTFSKNKKGNNYDGFTEHRYDQSVLTNLKVKYDIYSSNEIRQFVVCNVPIIIKPNIKIKDGDKQFEAEDITFIIPVKYDSPDRKENIEIILYYLKKYFKTNIIVGEQGGTYFEYLSDSVKYVKFDYPLFYRTKILNQLTLMAETELIFNWDADVIVPVDQMKDAINILRSGKSFVFPYKDNFIRLNRDIYNIREKINTNFDFTEITNSIITSVGGAIGFNKSEYIKCGLENENIIGWGYEDNERVSRIKKLGYDIEQVSGDIFHIEHQKSIKTHHYTGNNRSEARRISEMTINDLSNYIRNWKWIKNISK